MEKEKLKTFYSNQIILPLTVGFDSPMDALFFATSLLRFFRVRVSRFVLVLVSLCVFCGVRGGGASSLNECGGGGNRAEWSGGVGG